jgi:multicomponent K+:H+ antiporter subunit D
MTDALIAAPILLPALAATASLVFWLRYRWLGAVISIGAIAGLVLIALLLLARASTGQPQAYALGGWPAPFGIVLLLDRLSALLLLLTAVLALAVAFHAWMTGLDRKGWHFHPLLQFQLLGINGAFLTGDLFNLFVFFEVLLIASYALLLHGQGAQRLTAGLHYVIVNLVGSVLFLFALGLLYGVTGTLNMADMAVRGALLPVGDRMIFRAGGYLLATVFALKAALLPLHLWLPRTYAAAAPPVAALFAVMTKVGAYALVRTMPLIFGKDASGVLLMAALATVILGFAGLLAARGLRELATFALLGSTATLLVAVAPLDAPALAAALYYLPHTTISAALLFLTADLILRWRGGVGEAIEASPPYRGKGLLALLFFCAAIAIIGLPPLSGFIGKLLILEAALGRPHDIAIWVVILASSLAATIGFARAGSRLFWKPAPPDGGALSRNALAEALPAAFLLAFLIFWSVGAGPATAYAEATARQLAAANGYVGAVLGPAWERKP